jgi:hypothetical protein
LQVRGSHLIRQTGLLNKHNTKPPPPPALLLALWIAFVSGFRHHPHCMGGGSGCAMLHPSARYSGTPTANPRLQTVHRMTFHNVTMCTTCNTLYKQVSLTGAQCLRCSNMQCGVLSAQCTQCYFQFEMHFFPRFAELKIHFEFSIFPPLKTLNVPPKNQRTGHANTAVSCRTASCLLQFGSSL